MRNAEDAEKRRSMSRVFANCLKRQPRPPEQAKRPADTRSYGPKGSQAPQKDDHCAEKVCIRTM